MTRIYYEPIFNFLKVSEGGPGCSWMVKYLKVKGIRAKCERSIYVGHSLLTIEKGKVSAAKKELRKAGVRL